VSMRFSLRRYRGVKKGWGQKLVVPHRRGLCRSCVKIGLIVSGVLAVHQEDLVVQELCGMKSQRRRTERRPRDVSSVLAFYKKAWQFEVSLIINTNNRPSVCASPGIVPSIRTGVESRTPVLLVGLAHLKQIWSARRGGGPLTEFCSVPDLYSAFIFNLFYPGRPYVTNHCTP
jgi:hypothetical protein